MLVHNLFVLICKVCHKKIIKNNSNNFKLLHFHKIHSLFFFQPNLSYLCLNKLNYKTVWPVWPLSSLITRRRRVLQMKEEMRRKILHKHTDRTKKRLVHINKKERINRFPIQEEKIFLPKPVR